MNNQFKRAEIVMIAHKKLSTTLTKYLPDQLSLNNDLLLPHTNQHLHAYSDDPITEEDHWLDLDCNRVWRGSTLFELANMAPSCKKIIATTNRDLCYIKHDESVPFPKGVQIFVPEFPTNFLKKYVDAYNNKNKIVSVEVEYEQEVYNVNSINEFTEERIRLDENKYIIIK